MKTAHAMAALFLVSFLSSHGAPPALSGNQFPLAPDPAAAATQNNPTLIVPTPTPDPVDVDPDAVPRAYAHPPKPEPTPAEAAVAEQRKQKALEKKDWLIRGYMKELLAHPLLYGETSTSDFYTEISGDKTLAKAAGIPEADLLDKDSPDTKSSSEDDGDKPTTETSSDAQQDANEHPADTAQVPNPFLVPLQLVPSLTDSPVDANNSLVPALQREPSPVEDVSVKGDSDIILDNGALEIPGMTAAEGDPNRQADSDLTLDLLPGETPEQAKAEHENAIELPLSTDAQRLQHQQQVALQIPGKKDKPVAVKPPVVYPSDTAEMAPNLHQIRGSVDDPYDILR